MLKRFSVIAVFIFFTAAVFPQSYEFSNLSLLSVDGGVTFASTDYSGMKPGLLTRTTFDYFFKQKSDMVFGLRLLLQGGNLRGSADNRVPDEFKTNFVSGGTGILFGYAVSRYLLPYGYIGGSFLWYDPLDKDGKALINNANSEYNKTDIDLTGEFGFKYRLNKSLLLNLSGTINVNPNDRLDDLALGKADDIFGSVQLGISYVVGGLADEDDDGIDDDWDRCPGTPAGVEVDDFGCPVDTDRDGIPDYLDICPDTPLNVEVTQNGCPVDVDLDGVPDYLDRCNDTPPAVKVDIFGCPLDTDDDGVPDYMDKCPATHKGTKVDSAGCPVQVLMKKDTLINTPGPVKAVPVLMPHVYDPLNEQSVKGNIYTDGTQFCVQVSSWRTEKKAKSEMNKLIKKGYKAFVQQWFVSSKKGTWYRVRVGYFDSLQDAETVEKKLK